MIPLICADTNSFICVDLRNLREKQRGCLKSQNPLTAETAKIFRRDRRDLYVNALTLSLLRKL